MLKAAESIFQSVINEREAAISPVVRKVHQEYFPWVNLESSFAGSQDLEGILHSIRVMISRTEKQLRDLKEAEEDIYSAIVADAARSRERWEILLNGVIS